MKVGIMETLPDARCFRYW